MDKAVPVDVYVYLLKATVKDTDNHIIKSGRVTVVR